MIKGGYDVKSMKARAIDWLKEQDKLHLFDREGGRNDAIYYFKLVGFADEPEVYIQSTFEELEIGYRGLEWNGHEPIQVNIKKHILPWELLKTLSKEEKLNEVLSLLIKTINSRKRHYRKCNYCGEKVAVEHRYDKHTCHSCSSTYLGILY